MSPEKQIINAAKSREFQTVKALLQKDPDLVHATGPDGSTPLHHAAWKGYTEIAELLLDAGLILTLTTAINTGEQPLSMPHHMASERSLYY